MFVRFYQNKCYKSLLISLSKVLLQKEAWGYHQKERRKKERKKKKKRWKEQKKDENKDSPCSHQKNFHDQIRERYVSRSIIKFVYPSIHHITTDMHILIWLYDIFLLGSIVWLSKICNASMPSYFSLPKLHISFLEIGRKRRQCYDMPWWGTKHLWVIRD